jgi:hypothetical protein
MGQHIAFVGGKSAVAAVQNFDRANFRSGSAQAKDQRDAACKPQ